jgi:hypothetical protein
MKIPIMEQIKVEDMFEDSRFWFLPQNLERGGDV